MPAALGVLALLVLALGAALLRARRRATWEREAGHAEAATLRLQVEELERRLAGRHPAPAVPGREYVITHVGDAARPRHSAAAPAAPGPARVEPVLFADLVLREGVVRAAALAHGVRVALSPETRDRIRFEVRREVRRARRERRNETRLARREHASRRRAALTGDEDAA